MAYEYLTILRYKSVIWRLPGKHVSSFERDYHDEARTISSSSIRFKYDSWCKDTSTQALNDILHDTTQ